MPVPVIVEPKCTLAASHAAPLMGTHDAYADETDRRTDARQTVTLSFRLDAASIIIYYIIYVGLRRISSWDF